MIQLVRKTNGGQYRPMNLLSASLLILSISLSAGRNILSKGISGVPFGRRPYFIIQIATFLTGTVLLFAMNPTAFSGLALSTVSFAVLYALLMITAQWSYLFALKSGMVSICATMYSMGFIIPTLAGMISWGEAVTPKKIIGIIIIIPVIILSGMKNDNSGKSKSSSLGFIIPMIAALLASGFMGIVQKLMQSSAHPEQTPAFVIIAFAIAALASLGGALATRDVMIPRFKLKLGLSLGIGICYASCNLINTYLTGMLDSSVFFPTLNISMIILSMILGVLFFKEKPRIRQAAILALGISSILLITL